LRTEIHWGLDIEERKNLLLPMATLCAVDRRRNPRERKWKVEKERLCIYREEREGNKKSKTLTRFGFWDVRVCLRQYGLQPQPTIHTLSVSLVYSLRVGPDLPAPSSPSFGRSPYLFVLQIETWANTTFYIAIFFLISRIFSFFIQELRFLFRN